MAGTEMSFLTPVPSMMKKTLYKIKENSLINEIFFFTQIIIKYISSTILITLDEDRKRQEMSLTNRKQVLAINIHLPIITTLPQVMGASQTLIGIQTTWEFLLKVRCWFSKHGAGGSRSSFKLGFQIIPDKVLVCVWVSQRENPGAFIGRLLQAAS